MSNQTRILFRPVGPAELALIAASSYRAFPPRLAEQPTFYPVTNEVYARQITRDGNVKQSGSGFVTRFAVREEFIARYPVHRLARGCAASAGFPPMNGRSSIATLSVRSKSSRRSQTTRRSPHRAQKGDGIFSSG